MPTGGIVAAREARRRGLHVEPIYTIALILVGAAVVGGRAFPSRSMAVRTSQGRGTAPAARTPPGGAGQADKL